MKPPRHKFRNSNDDKSAGSYTILYIIGLKIVPCEHSREM